MTKKLWWRVALVAAAFGSGCAGPRIVNSMGSTRDGKFRVLYYRDVGMGNTEQGIVDCKAEASGTISNCAQVHLNFQEDS